MAIFRSHFFGAIPAISMSCCLRSEYNRLFRIVLLLSTLFISAQSIADLHDHDTPLQHLTECGTCLVVKIGDNAATGVVLDFNRISVCHESYTRPVCSINRFLTSLGNRDPPETL